MGNPIHKDSIFQMLKDAFQINLFYKPTMESGDIHYHIILDNVIKMTLVLIGNNFLVIDNIESLTSSYMPKTYVALVECLIEQKTFTILIERLGNTHVIDDACIKKEVPIVVDERFITIPKKLYNMYMRYYGENQDSYGFYLLAVNSDLSDIPENKPVKENKSKEQPEPKVKKVKPDVPITGREKTHLFDILSPADERILSIFDSRTVLLEKELTANTDYKFVIRYLGILDVHMRYYTTSKTGDQNSLVQVVECIDIEKIEPAGDSVSAVVYMELLSKLEKITSVFDVRIMNVKNKFVYDVCMIRQYPIIKTRPNPSRMSMGNYQMKEYNYQMQSLKK